jgi:Zn-dependent M28 family amino/carboxypeptidase
MFRQLFAIAPLLLAGTVAAQAPAAPATSAVAATNARINAPLPADQAAMKAHVMFLASDAMKGREAGSAEFDIAAQYVAAQFYAAGLRPGGDDGGYQQAVPLVGYTAAGDASATWTPVGGAPRRLVTGTDIMAVANPAARRTAIDAPVVFLGYGLEAAAFGLDDYRGADVRGKVVAVVLGTPPGLPTEVAATLAGLSERVAAAARHGAVGLLVLFDTAGGTQAAARFAEGARGPRTERITWATPQGVGGSEAPGTPMLGFLSATGGEKLFGPAWGAVRKAAARKRVRTASIAAPGRLSFESQTSFRAMASSNVIGMIPGGDPALAGQYVVLSAHLDHIGVGKPVAGDAINNGALDDGIGIASLIEEARRFKAAAPPRRSIIFLAVTGEEKGLVGSDYFVSHPVVPMATIVADVNLDMPILTYKFEDMVAFGGDRSTLGPIIARAVAQLGVTMSPDPMPEEAIFVRSDHYNFVRHGVPSIFLWPGQKGPGKAATETFMTRHYHQPSDDLTLPIMWDQAVRFVDANYRIAREIADADARPVWNRGDYFGLRYGGVMAR